MESASLRTIYSLRIALRNCSSDNYFSHLSVTLIIIVHKGLKCLECLQLLRIILVNESTSAKLSRNRVDDYRENLCFKACGMEVVVFNDF